MLKASRDKTINTFISGKRYTHIATSQMICIAKQIDSFVFIRVKVFKLDIQFREKPAI